MKYEYRFRVMRDGAEFFRVDFFGTLDEARAIRRGLIAGFQPPGFEVRTATLIRLTPLVQSLVKDLRG